MAGARRLMVRIDGEAADGLTDDLITLEVTDGLEDHPSFRMDLVIRKRADGSWTHLDPGPERVLSLWQRVTIEAGFGANVDVVFDGYVAGISPVFTADEASCRLQVWGFGASWSMAQQEKVVAWPDKRFSEVASAIFRSYGLTPEVDESPEVHQADDRLLLQRGTDWAYLRRLARRLGYELYVEGAKGVFRRTRLDGAVQNDIAAFFGPTATNLVRFTPVVRAGLPSTVRLAQADTRARANLRSEAATSPLEALGKRGGAALRAGREQAAGDPVRLTATAPTGSQLELDALTGALRQQADWLVEGDGELDGALYGQVLRAKRLVNIKGIGMEWSGTWYVHHVLHRFSATRYEVRFRVRRNGLGLTGAESFQHVGSMAGAPGPAPQPAVTTARSGEVVKP